MGDVSVEFKEIFKMGYLWLKIPKDVSRAISDEVDSMIAKNFKGAIPYNNSLAGAINHEYILTKSAAKIEELVAPVSATYWRHWGIDKENRRHFIRKLDDGNLDIWANFQKKYEHNPLHTHGGILSFVIWHRVPYDIEHERRLPHLSKGNTNAAGIFQFNYPNHLDKGGVGQYQIVIDKQRENEMIVFPAWLQHSVHPFYTSDDYRISISGNIEHD